MLNLAVSLQVDSFQLLSGVPGCCGLTIENEATLQPEDAERMLNWYYGRSPEYTFDLKVTDASFYERIICQCHCHDRSRGEGADRKSSNCQAGGTTCFSSHQGEVVPCGFPREPAANIKENGFPEIWNNAFVFQKLRDNDNLKGKCGICEHDDVYTKSRARACETSGD